MSTTPEGKEVALADMLHDLRVLHEQTTPGTWGKGPTTHHTVSRRTGHPPYRIAEFHHAHDAAFLDACHAFMPKILVSLESLAATPSALPAAPPTLTQITTALREAGLQLVRTEHTLRIEKAITGIAELVIAAPQSPAPEAVLVDAERYQLLRDWCVRQHKLFVSDGNNPVYEDELDARLDAIRATLSAGKGR